MASRAVVQRGVPVVAALILTGACGTHPAPPEYAGICVDPVTNQRVDDDRCGEPDDFGHTDQPGGMYFLWFPTGYAGSVPAVGATMPPAHQGAGLRTIPNGRGTLLTGVPCAGGSMPSIVRGGLGVSAGGKGGGS